MEDVTCVKFLYTFIELERDTYRISSEWFFQLAWSSLAVFPLHSYVDDVEQRFKKFWTIYDI